MSEKLPLMIDAGEYNLNSNGAAKRKVGDMADGRENDIMMVDVGPPLKKRNVSFSGSHMSPRKPMSTVAPIKPRSPGKPYGEKSPVW